MKIIKKGLLFIAAVLAGLMCMGGIFNLTVLLRYADFKQGKAVITVIFLMMIAGFGFASFKCFKSVFHKEKILKKDETVNLLVEELPVQPVAKEQVEHVVTPEVSVAEEKIRDHNTYQKKEESANNNANSKNNVSGKIRTINLQDYADVQQEYDFVVCHVRYNTIPHDIIPFSFEEEVFFKALIKEMKENKLWNKEGLRLTRLADYAFNVDCHTCYIGKVKLRNKMFIQVQRGSTQIKRYQSTELEEILDKIPAWIRYIKYCRRN